MKVLLPILFLALPFYISAQPGPNNPEYKRLVETAFAQLQSGDCKSCLENYEQAFALSKHSALSHLRAALCAEKCGNVEKRDALVRSAAVIGWDVCLKVLDDPAQYPEFKQNSPFEKVARQVAQQQAETLGINFSLLKELEHIRYLDQKYRLMMDSVQYEHPNGTPEYQAFIADWILNDSLNMARIEEIIAEYGFPGKSMVGEQGASTVWLVIQHAPIEKQEKYFPMLTEAAEKGELRKSDWAYLLDRINMRKGLPQVYGSQVVTDPKTGAYVFHTIEDEANVNKRRAEVGLGPLEDYARMMGVDWQLPQKD